MSSNNFLNSVDTHFLICNEKITGKGEDSALKILLADAGVIGVFDGCGGLGSATSEHNGGKTEAYLAARVASGSVKQWFYYCLQNHVKWDSLLLKEIIVHNLEGYQEKEGRRGLKLKGSMMRPFPSTIAGVTFSKEEDGIYTYHFWAGDSRTYILDKNGLGQVSHDDLDNKDALLNLTKDGALTNVTSADGNFVIHSCQQKIEEPSLVFASSDGCFGYLTSPMAFEELILGTLMQARNISEWKEALDRNISDIAGDDQSFVVVGFGFKDFTELKRYYMKRFKFINKISDEFQKSNFDNQQKIWISYKKGYYRFQ